MSYKSPGVTVNNRQVITSRRPTEAIRAAFVGNFQKGPVGESIPITSISEFIHHFGIPTDTTYNDWFQIQRYLRYFPGVYVTRAANLDHTFDACADIDTDITVTIDTKIKTLDLGGSNPFNIGSAHIERLRKLFKKYDRFTISGDNADNGSIYTVTDVDNFDFTPKLRWDVFKGNQIMRLNGVVNSSIEMPSEAQFKKIATSSPNGLPTNEAFVESYDAFEIYSDSFNFNNTASPLAIWARSPGSWGDGLQVAIVSASDFKVNYSAQDSRAAKLAFDGVVVDHAFRNAPTGNQFGVLVSLDGKLVEQFIVSENRQGPNFIEDEINKKSAYIFVKRGIGNLYSTAASPSDLNRPLRLLGGRDAEVQVSDLTKAYEIFEDKETYRIDVVIGNELDKGMSAKNLAIRRQDCHAIVGMDHSLFVNRDAAKTVDNMVDFREHLFSIDGCVCSPNTAANTDQSTLGAQVLKSPNVVLIGNYLSVHDPYANKTRMINIAGDIAGIRCRTNSDFGEWKASAGVNRGVLVDGARLVFNPSKAHRDILYSHSINPVMAMAGVGNVLMGNRTLDDLNSYDSKWNVRSMIHMLARSGGDTLRTYVMESINPYTMHAAVASLTPVCNTVKAGGGITDYYIQCDTQNNPDETSMDDTLVVDLYLKPTGIAEYIVLNLTNTGSETIASVIQREQLRRA